MTTPIDPSDINALAAIARKATRFDGFIPATVAAAIARAVVPDGFMVARRDDLETALYGAQYWGKELRQDGEQEALDRLRALLGGEG